MRNTTPMKKTLLFILALWSSAMAWSQSLAPSVIALAGDLEETPSGMTLSWTLGEPVIATHQTASGYLTQGFQQPDLQISTGFIDQTFDFDLSIFPNPAEALLLMQTDYRQEVSHRLVDIQGKLISKGVWTSQYELDVSALPSGIYAIYLMADGRMVRSELIQKQ